MCGCRSKLLTLDLWCTGFSKRLKDNGKTVCVYVQITAKQIYLTSLQYVHISMAEVCVSEPTYLVTRHFCGKITMLHCCEQRTQPAVEHGI